MYSTCTTNVIENEEVVAKVLEALGESVELMHVEVEEKSEAVGTGLALSDRGKIARFRPHIHGTGGFFIAKFRKRGKIKEES